MAIKITVRQGGAVGASTLDMTAQTRVLDSEFAAGHMCANGSACQYTFVVDDDPNEIPEYGVKAFAARNVVTISEDAPGSDIWLARGRVANTETQRGDVAAGDAVSHKITVEDGNVDLRGIVLEADWVRSTETGAARAIALMEAFCQTDPRLTTDIDTHLVDAPSSNSLDDYTYPKGMAVIEVMEDIASQDGKIFGVVIHHDGGSHLCLLYTGETNHSTYPCTLSITDTNPDLSTEFPPSWRQGAAVHRDGQGVISGVFSKYGMGDDSFVTAEDADLVATYDHWWITNNDTTANTGARAQLRANNLLLYRGQEHITHQVSIKVPADKVHLLCAGMSIDMRSAASAGGEALGTTITRRITTLKWEPVAPEVGAVVGHYYAHMELDRPQRILPERKTHVPKQAESGGSQPFITDSADGQDDDGNQDIAITVGSQSDRVMYVATLLDEDPTIAWHPSYINAGTPGAGTSLTLVDSQVITGTHTIYLYRLVAPATSVETTSAVRLSKGAGVRAITGVWVVADADQSTPETDTSKSTGSGTTSSVTVTPGTNDLIIDVAGWAETNATVTTPAEAGDNTQDFARTYDRTFGLPDYAFGGAHGSDATPAWNFTNSHTWGALAWAVKTANAGSTTQPVGGTGTGTVGDGDGTYVGPEHVHEHGNITTGGPYHMAEDVTAADAGGYFTGTTVEAQLQELGAGSGSADDTALTRHAVHGTFVAAYHRASDQIPLILYSDDGITFRDGAAILTALRDPSIMHWDGKFWATCTNSATAIVVFSSPDLETWTQIATPTTDGSGTQSWAPEWIRNVDGTPYLHPSTGLPCLTVNVSTDSETTFTVREMHPTNRAMTSWSATTTITGTGLPTTMIDGFLMADTDTFYLWFKDEANKHIEIGESSSLTSGYTLLESGDWAGWFAAKDAGADSIEGPCVIRLDDGRWRIYFNENNGLSSIRAVYSETTDDWRTGTSTWTTQASITTDALMSHGTVLFIPGVYDHQRDPDAHPDKAAADHTHDASVWHPLMAQDPSDSKWYVVVDGDGTAIMVEAP